jgi:hypothetical protein
MDIDPVQDRSIRRIAAAQEPANSQWPRAADVQAVRS